MDLQFLKFWGDAIRQSSTVQKLGDEVSRWMKGEIKETDDLYTLFRKYYGLDQGTEVFKDYENQLKELVGDFQKSFKELLPMLGVVPKTEYDQLLQQYDDLKKKVAGLETALKEMGNRLSSATPGQTAGAGAFEQMIKAQTEQFQKMMNAFTEISGQMDPKDKKK
jgi:hypothetical protein